MLENFSKTAMTCKSSRITREIDHTEKHENSKPETRKGTFFSAQVVRKRMISFSNYSRQETDLNTNNKSLTAPFWLVNLRVDGARATEEAAAAAATRILQNKIYITSKFRFAAVSSISAA